MRSLLKLTIFTTLISSPLSQAAGLEANDLIGEYLGSGNCAVRVEAYRGNQLKFTILRSGKNVVSDTIPMFRVETIAEDEIFSLETEGIGSRGKEIKVISGTVKYKRLKSLTLKNRRGLFSVKSTSCFGLVPLMPSL